MAYSVEFSPAASADLERLFDFSLQRELDSETGDLDIPTRALQAIQNAIQLMALTPFSCRKAGDSPFLRELVIGFGHTGYVALFEIVNDQRIIVGAVRHQREDDYH